MPNLSIGTKAVYPCGGKIHMGPENDWVTAETVVFVRPIPLIKYLYLEGIADFIWWEHTIEQR